MRRMNQDQKQFRRRLAMLGFIAFAGIAALLVRLAWLQAFQ